LTARRVRYDLDEARRHLTRVDARLAPWLERVGPCTLRLRALQPFESLLGSILHQ
jgi:3-methyladenine DNA glycosylase/8-oxoguanine DNA glycosylase